MDNLRLHIDCARNFIFQEFWAGVIDASLGFMTQSRLIRHSQISWDPEELMRSVFINETEPAISLP